MKANKYRLNRIYIGLVVCVSFLGACDSYDDEPVQKNQEEYSSEYAMPAGSYLTDQDRIEINARNKEYKDYMKSLNNN